MAKRWAFLLVKLEGTGAFFFDFFPKDIQTTRRANWEMQDTTIGIKPILYANGEPKRISIPEVWLDRTDSNTSIRDDIAALEALMAEDPKLGRPPALQVIWGQGEGGELGRDFRCVLEEVAVRRTWFSPDGDAQRASVSLQLIEFQPEQEDVSSRVVEVDDDDAGHLGNF
jgi:hypothetical protein